MLCCFFHQWQFTINCTINGILNINRRTKGNNKNEATKTHTNIWIDNQLSVCITITTLCPIHVYSDVFDDNPRCLIGGIF